MSRKELTKAVAYFRTSSATNVGPDKDSLKRQRAAVVTFAKSAGYEIVEEFYDAAVSGADAIDERPGFAAMLQRLLGNGVGTIIVETASRFARDLVVQETGWRFLRNAGEARIPARSRTERLRQERPLEIASNTTNPHGKCRFGLGAPARSVPVQVLEAVLPLEAQAIGFPHAGRLQRHDQIKPAPAPRLCQPPFSAISTSASFGPQPPRS
jgi:hypothetical protein